MCDIGYSSKINDFQFGQGKKRHERLEMPTKMMYYQHSIHQWSFVCGHELETLVRSGRITEADVLHNVKLGFFEHAETTRFKAELEERLAPSGKRKTTLLEDYLRVILQSTTNAMAAATPTEYSLEFLNRTRLVVIITMPDNIGESYYQTSTK